MKILYVITKSNWGGAQKYVYDLATSLPRERFETVVAFGGSGPLGEKLAAAGIRTVSIPSLGRDVNIFRDISSFFSLLFLFRRERPDIVHVNSSKVGGLGALAARATWVPKIVFTCHGWPFNEERGLLSLWIIRLLSWLTVMLSHITIAVSERDYTDGIHMLGAREKMRLVHNGVRTPKFLPRTEALAYIHTAAKNVGVHIGTEDYIVGAIGELHRNKGYEYLLQAIAEVNHSVKLVIMGEGEERASLVAFAKKIGIEKRVAFLGFVKDAPTYLSGCDTLVLSSIKEGLPYVVIEAGFAGIPVIATNVGGVKEIIDDMKSGILVQTRKTRDIAQAIDLMRKDPERGHSFGTALKEKVSQNFSLEHMTTNTLLVYEQSIYPETRA